MEFLKNIKWYHVTALSLFVIVLAMIFMRVSEPSICSIPPAMLEPEVHMEGGEVEGFNGDKDEIVLYYAMWCGYSRAFLPEWEKFEQLAGSQFPNLKVSRVRCEGGMERACSEKGVDGYPTVILYKKDGSKRSFQDDRTMDKLVSFVKNN